MRGEAGMAESELGMAMGTSQGGLENACNGGRTYSGIYKENLRDALVASTGRLTMSRCRIEGDGFLSDESHTSTE